MTNNFELIYKKIEEAKTSTNLGDSVEIKNNKDISIAEIDEINELRKMVLEINEPESCTYTSS